ncbi:MAG: metallophosphoesterase [Candidatus Micrarchaeaceae archaeon]
MRLNRKIELGEGIPVAYISELDSIVCSDLHLGYEGVMADKGVFLPKANLKNIIRIITEACNEFSPSKIIIDGDIKNEFSNVHVEEFNEFRELISFMKAKTGIKEIILVKGNHDNFVDRLSRPLGFEIYRQEYKVFDYLFFHGEEDASEEKKTMVMGHMHPAIAIYNSVGVKEKVKCFLYGKTKKGNDLLILPAMSYYSEGVESNMMGGDLYDLAPIFKKRANIDNLRAYCLGEHETIDFGTIGELRKAAYD